MEDPQLMPCVRCDKFDYEATPNLYTLSPVNDGNKINLIVWVCKNCGHILMFKAD